MFCQSNGGHKILNNDRNLDTDDACNMLLKQWSLPFMIYYYYIILIQNRSFVVGKNLKKKPKKNKGIK